MQITTVIINRKTVSNHQCDYCYKNVGYYYRVFFGQNPRRTVHYCNYPWCRLMRWMGIYETLYNRKQKL